MKKAADKKAGLIIAAVAVLMLAIAVGAVLFIQSRYIFINGKLLPADSKEIIISTGKIDASKLLRLTAPESIDLTGTEIKPEDVSTLKSSFPYCHIRWSVPLSSGSFDSDSEEITIGSITESDLSCFSYFTDLKRVLADGIKEWQLLEQAEKENPQIEFIWDIRIGDKYYPSKIEYLEINDSVSFEELRDKLQAFPVLKSVSLQGCGLTVDEMLELLNAFPEMKIELLINVSGETVSNDVETLDFSGRDDIDIASLIMEAPLFTSLSTIDFSGTSYSDDDMLKVSEAFPDADVIWQLTIYGMEVSSISEEFDFSGIEVGSSDEIENALPYLKHLSKVVMSDCGLSDEEMDALNKRHEDVRFVWTVYFGKGYYLRTDATSFISSLFFGSPTDRRDLNDESIKPLKYCTDMVALDVGHQEFTNCSFCKDMKELRWFIGAGGRLKDISALANCKKLYYLELTLSPVRDLSPLLECKELRHLNICGCPTAESLDALAQMTWLERCYMAFGTCYDDKKDHDYVYSDEFLPNTEKWLRGVNFYEAWRTHPAYFEMRDALGAYYMVKKPDDF